MVPSQVRKAFWWLVVLLPALVCAMLVKRHVVDQRFLDDWVWAFDLVKFKMGTLTLTDLFAVHLEHRAPIARMLAIAVTVLSKGDIRLQCILTLLLILGAFLSIRWMWLRRCDMSPAVALVPLVVAGMILFSPVQWQTLLWPICSGTTYPLFFVSISIAFAQADWPWWKRCVACLMCSVAAILCFASGMLLWALPLPVLLLCGSYRDNRERWKCLACWLIVMALVLVPYFHNYKNAVPPQYAYGHGEENKMLEEAGVFFDSPVMDLHFVTVFLGVFWARGLHMDSQIAATYAGAVLLTLFMFAILYGAVFWRDLDLRRKLLPMLCLGAYSPLTGLMVALGRVSAGGVGSGMNVRYHVHQTLLPVALIGAAVVIGRHWNERRGAAKSSALAATGYVAGGAVFGMLAVAWIFGATMMEQWELARLKDAGAQRLSQISVEFNHFVSHAAGNFGICKVTTNDLDSVKMLRRPPLRDAKLSNFRTDGSPLGGAHASFDVLVKRSDKNWEARGHAFFPRSERPVDGILFAFKVPDGEWTIFAYTQTRGVPYYLSRALGKDLQFISADHRNPWPDEFVNAWERHVAWIQDPPANAVISAWALDAQKMQLHLLTGRPSKTGKPGEYGIEEIAQELPES